MTTKKQEVVLKNPLKQFVKKKLFLLNRYSTFLFFDVVFSNNFKLRMTLDLALNT